MYIFCFWVNRVPDYCSEGKMQFLFFLFRSCTKIKFGHGPKIKLIILQTIFLLEVNNIYNIYMVNQIGAGIGC